MIHHRLSRSTLSVGLACLCVLFVSLQACSIQSTPSQPGQAGQETPTFNVEEFFRVWDQGLAVGQPTTPTTFTISESWFVTEIQSFHWNNGQGVANVGIIALRFNDGARYVWRAIGKPGEGGVPNAYWVVTPNIVLPPGTYTVENSDWDTWSQNAATGNAGMAWGSGIRSETPVLPFTPQPMLPTVTKTIPYPGKYSCSDCISDQYLEDFKLLGGFIPLEWVGSGWTYLSVTVDQAGNVTEANTYLSISTSLEGCSDGIYNFDATSATGKYDPATKLLVVDMTGDESHSSLEGGTFCAKYDLNGTTTIRFVFMANAQGSLVLCKPGETGDACLNNPMAILTY